jgi:hypothetical protein
VFLKGTMKIMGWSSCIIVADFTHYARTVWLAKRLKVPNCEVVASYWDPEQGNLGMGSTELMLRELAAVIVTAWLPKTVITRIRDLFHF